jgi:hypothetical protein
MMMLSALTAAIILFTPLHVSGGPQAGPTQIFGAQQRNQWNDPEYLESLREHAKRITLKEGEVKQIELIMKQSGSQ